VTEGLEIAADLVHAALALRGQRRGHGAVEGRRRVDQGRATSRVQASIRSRARSATKASRGSSRSSDEAIEVGAAPLLGPHVGLEEALFSGDLEAADAGLEVHRQRGDDLDRLVDLAVAREAEIVLGHRLAEEAALETPLPVISANRRPNRRMKSERYARATSRDRGTGPRSRAREVEEERRRPLRRLGDADAAAVGFHRALAEVEAEPRVTRGVGRRGAAPGISRRCARALRAGSPGRCC